MSNNNNAGACTIVVADLFAKINNQRKMIKKPPIEERALISRLTLRFNVQGQRWVDFAGAKVSLTKEEVPALEKIINDQFGVFFTGEVARLCINQQAASRAPRRAAVIEEMVEEATEEPEVEAVGFFAWLKYLITGR